MPDLQIETQWTDEAIKTAFEWFDPIDGTTLKKGLFHQGLAFELSISDTGYGGLEWSQDTCDAIWDIVSNKQKKIGIEQFAKFLNDDVELDNEYQQHINMIKFRMEVNFITKIIFFLFFCVFVFFFWLCEVSVQIAQKKKKKNEKKKMKKKQKERYQKGDALGGDDSEEEDSSVQTGANNDDKKDFASMNIGDIVKSLHEKECTDVEFDWQLMLDSVKFIASCLCEDPPKITVEQFKPNASEFIKALCIFVECVFLIVFGCWFLSFCFFLFGVLAFFCVLVCVCVCVCVC